jgi:hypothetical protein
VSNTKEPIFSNLWTYLGRSLWDLRGISPYDFHDRIMKMPEDGRFEEFETCFHEYLERAGKLIRECCARCCDRILSLPTGGLSEDVIDKIQDAIENHITRFSDHTRRWLWRVCEGPKSLRLDLSRIEKAHLEWSAPNWLIQKQLSDMLRWEEGARSCPVPELNKLALDRLESELKDRTSLRLRDGVFGDELLLLKSAVAVNRFGSLRQPHKAQKNNPRGAATAIRDEIRAAVMNLKRQSLTYEQMMPELDRLKISIPTSVSWLNAAPPNTLRTWENAWRLNDRKGYSKPISQYLGYLVRESEAQG